jgi:serine/threonine protein kinase
VIFISSELFIYEVSDIINKKTLLLRISAIENEEQKNDFDKLVVKWKDAAKSSSHISEYEVHWYENGVIYVIMEFCSKRTLGSQISVSKKNGRKFSEKVFFFFSLLYFNVLSYLFINRKF